MSKFKYVDLTFKNLADRIDVGEIISSQQHSLLYLNYLDTDIEKKVIKFCGTNQSFKRNTIHYEFIKGKGRKLAIHFRLFTRLRSYKPDAILIHSFRYCFQLILVRLFVGKKTKIMVQNHAEQPYNFPKKIIQIITEKFLDIYFITSYEQAAVWVDKKIFSSTDKIREMMEGSTFFSYQDKSLSKKILNKGNDTIFLWCGSLNSNKDPLTILHAFTEYYTTHNSACLYMVYNSFNLLNEVMLTIKINRLETAVVLVGNIPHLELEKYYQAADYFILGSHREGSGFSLCEAMACGCIPIVTNIPSFKKMTNNGDCGFLFLPSDKSQLTSILLNLHNYDKSALIEKVLNKFTKDLSFKAIASAIEKEIKS